MKTLLFLTLILVAPVAGAGQGFHCKDCTLTDVHTNQDQPAGEAKKPCPQYNVAIELKDGSFYCFDEWNGTVVNKKGEIIIGNRSGTDKPCSNEAIILGLADGTSKCLEPIKQSDAEKWKELCDKFIEAVREGVYDQTPVNHMKERLDFANLLCTRYTAALLEEMRNK